MKVITTADDFGFSSGVNRAVLRAHREGVLTSASLMVTGDAASEAVEIARANPGLAVGLHLALSRARSALPREAVPDLVDADSRFPASAVNAGLRCYFSRRARTQLRTEIEAQFEAFARHGIPLSHVDGHQHLHAHPVVLPIVVELAARYGACGIRMPREPLVASLRADLSRPVEKLAVAMGHAVLRICARRRLSGSCDLVIGSMMSGAMTDDYVIKVLSDCASRRSLGPLAAGEPLSAPPCARCEELEVPRLQVGGCPDSGFPNVQHSNLPTFNCEPTPTRGYATGCAEAVEVLFHPCEDESGEPFGPNPGDLRALLSPRLKEFLTSGGYELTTYAGLTQEAMSERR